MVMKYLEELDEERSTGVEGAAAETTRLWSRKTVRFTYGTCEQDLESGACTGTSFSSSSGSGDSSSTSSPEDLYDKKLCVICYDEQRNCFFVPCGHCATCYVCAQRYASYIEVAFVQRVISLHNFLSNSSTYFFLQDFQRRKQDVSGLPKIHWQSKKTFGSLGPNFLLSPFVIFFLIFCLDIN